MQEVANKTVLPAVFLYITAGISFMCWLLVVVNTIFNPQRQEPPGTQVAALIIFAFILIAHLFIIVGAFCMQTHQGYGFAVASAVLSVIPCCSPCFVLGFPFGIWALVVLLDEEVQRVFHQSV